ncbi:MAG: apolipoprotein N-acyltransferase [candidate division Zixibacteria bacterium]|nr:apolipoprotein N-acyltransferase [candidate division Zixibacteria bacterium]
MRYKIWLISISALLTALAFPPYKTGFLIYLAPLILLFVLEKTSSRQAFGYGYIWGLIFNFGILYGVFWATVSGSFGMLAAMSLLPAFNCYIYKLISNSSKTLGYLSWPLIWLNWNYLRTFTELNFPWADYGYTQSYYLPLIQPAEIFGVYGVSLMIHIVNVLLFIFFMSDYKRKTRLASLATAILLPILFLIYGWVRLPSASEQGSFKVALAQGNITRDIKWKKGGKEASFNTYIDMTRQVAEEEVDLVVWPETATPMYLVRQPKWLSRVKDIVDSAKTNILTGTPQYERVGVKEYIYFNAAALISAGIDSIPVYEKIKLVPLSERIPFSGRFKKLKEIRLGQADFSSGRYRTIFDLKDTKFAALICFESAFPGYCADFCRQGAEFLVVITNDMWFGRSSMPFQHARMSVFRAIENRVPIARCANTGVSMFIDSWGRTTGVTKMNEQKLIYGNLRPEQSTSLYNRWGDFLPKASIFGTLLFIIIAIAFAKRGKYNE